MALSYHGYFQYREILLWKNLCIVTSLHDSLTSLHDSLTSPHDRAKWNNYSEFQLAADNSFTNGTPYISTVPILGWEFELQGYGKLQARPN